MALPLNKFREIVFHLLYSVDFSSDAGEDSFSFWMQHHKITKKNLHEAHSRVKEVVEKLPQIDQMITQAAVDYSFERIPYVERNILRLGVFELMFSPGFPPKVAISEAMRLAKKFATPESVHFINAILDAIYKKV